MASAEPIQGRICVAQSEALDMGMNDRACGEIEKLLGILACEIGDRTDDALTPQQGIRHGRNIAHMDAAKHHDATFTHAGKCRRYEAADRCKDDGGVEGDGRVLPRGASHTQPSWRANV